MHHSIPRLLYSIMIISMLLQPVGAPGVYIAIAEDSVSDVQAEMDSTAKDENFKAEELKKEAVPSQENQEPISDEQAEGDALEKNPNPSELPSENEPISGETVAGDGVKSIGPESETVKEAEKEKTETIPDDGDVQQTPILESSGNRRLCLAEGTEIINSKNSDWNMDGKNVAETEEEVKLGLRYVFPGNENVSITFTCLPEKTSTLKIEQIETSDLKLPAGIIAASEYAYDITTKMKNGEFEYEIKLSKNKGVEAEVAYIEKSSDEIINEGLKKDDIKKINKNDTNNSFDTVQVDDLDHMTVFIPTLSASASSGQTTTGLCMEQAAGTNLNCTANDISLASVKNINILDDGCNAPGDTVTFEATWEVQSTSTERYDIGLYFATDGDPNGDGAYNGTCSVTTLANSPVPPWFNLDGDDCGDASSSATVNPIIQMTVQCLDDDEDNTLNLPYCTSWDNNVGGVCSSTANAVPGTSSKCNCEPGFEVPITVPYAADIEVIKNLVPSSDSGKFNLQVDGTSEATNVGDEGTTGKLTVGAGTSANPGAIHTVGETSAAGTNLSDYTSFISCVDRGLTTFDGGPALEYSGTGPLDVDVDKDDDIVCTIANTLKTGTLEIVKDVVPNDESTNWNIIVEGPTTFSDSFVGDDTTGAKTVNPGSYKITETAGSSTSLSNYDSSWVCTINGNPAVSGEGTVAEIGVGKNDAAVCTFTNALKAGKIIVDKITYPAGDSQSFSFSTAGVGYEKFSLTDLASPNEQILLAGTYSVSEAIPSGWYQTDASCTSSIGDNETIDSLELDPDETIRCAFTNTKKSHIIVKKDAMPDSSQEFIFSNNFGNGNPEIFGLTDDSAPGLPSFDAEVLPGTYAVSENFVSGWESPESARCNDGSPINAIEVSPGETVICTFTNEKLATINLVKNTVGGDGTFDFTLSGAGLPASASLSTSGGVASQTFSNLDPDNKYSISENVSPSGWANISSGYCDNGDPINMITPNAGENITCVFTNEKLSINVTKNANPSTVAEPGGNINFTVKVDNTSSVSVQLSSLTDDVYGDLNGKGSCLIPQSIAGGGYYECSFAGNVLGDVGSTHKDTVTAVASGASDYDDATVTIVNVDPTISVLKTANTPSVPETGGDVTFNFLVRNTSVEPVTITSLSDDKFGSLSGDADCQVGTILPYGGQCSFDATFAIPAGDYPGSHSNIFTAYAQDNEGEEAMDNDEETISYADVLPDVKVEKTAGVSEIPETGQDVTFTYRITNNGNEDVAVSEITDDKFGTLAGDADCQVGTLIPANSYCEFEATFAIPAGDFPDVHVNVFSATVTDGDGNSDSDKDDASINYTDVMPDISVLKTSDKDSVPETGADVVFTFRITNNGPEPVAINSLADSDFGILSGDGDCHVGTVLAKNDYCEFSITRFISGDYSGNDHQNVFTGKASDGDGNEDSDSDDAIVDFDDVKPSIEVSKTAKVSALPVPGGNVEFTVVVTNNSLEEVSLTNLSDNVYGDLNGKGTCAIGSTISSGGGTYVCKFEGAVSGNPGFYTDIVEAVVFDNDGSSDEATDDATVELEGGKIIIEKQTLPDGSQQSFEFDPSWSENIFSLTDGQQNDSGWLAPGTYSIAEVVPSGWDLTDITCIDPNQNSRAIAGAALMASINLEAGETINCIFTNTRRTMPLYVNKFEDHNANGAKDAQENSLDGWMMELYDNENCSGIPIANAITDSDAFPGTAIFPNLYQGETYWVREIEQPGWLNTSGNCRIFTMHDDLHSNNLVEFGNFHLGAVSGKKFNDTNNSGAYEPSELYMDGWQIRVYQSDGDGGWILPESRITGHTGVIGEYESNGYMFGKDIKICEVLSQGWAQTYPRGEANNVQGDEAPVCHVVSIDSSGLSFDNLDFGNAQLSDINGFKWNDLNGNGEWDCEESDDCGWCTDCGIFNSCGDCELFKEIGLYEDCGNEEESCEPKLSDWEIFIDENSNKSWDEGEKKTMTSEDGRYRFENLLPGEYRICEVLQEGWGQTYPGTFSEAECHTVNIPDSCGVMLQNDVVAESLIRDMAENSCEYNFGNKYFIPELTIEKFNSQWPVLQNIGSVINYSIIIRAFENNVKDVMVTDLPPEGFEYIEGTWNAESSLGPEHDGNLKLEHSYASPGTWDLGNMVSGEIITLSYQARISSDQQPGTYRDLAWAEGRSEISETNDVLATNAEAITRPLGNDDTGVISGTENFVGTQIALAGNVELQNVKLDKETDKDTRTKKRVLGATTYLPATGSNTGWIILAISLLLAGMALAFLGRKRKNDQNSQKDVFVKILTLSISLLALLPFFAKPAEAAIAPSIRLEQPDTPTNNKNLKIGFVVLDIENRGMTVNCYKDGPGSDPTVPFDTVLVQAGGNSGICEAVLSEDGAYDFFAKVDADGDIANSGSVTVVLAAGIPGKPLNYERDDNGCVVTFTTANDGLTKYVELYRSKKDQFAADSSTFSTKIAIGPNQSGSLTDPLGECNHYMYAIRAISGAGAGSDFVGDKDVDRETRTRTRTVTEENIVYTGAIPVSATGEESASVEGESTEEGMVAGAESENESGLGKKIGEIAGAITGENGKYWILGILAVLGLAYYAYRKSGKKENKPSE